MNMLQVDDAGDAEPREDITRTGVNHLAGGVAPLL